MKDGRSDRRGTKDAGAFVLGESALEIAHDYVSRPDRTGQDRTCLLSAARNLLSRGPGHPSFLGDHQDLSVSQTHRSMDRTQSHHVGKWQAKRDTHGKYSMRHRALCAHRIGPTGGFHAWSGTRGIILSLNGSGADRRQSNLSGAIAPRPRGIYSFSSLAGALWVRRSGFRCQAWNRTIHFVARRWENLCDKHTIPEAEKPYPLFSGCVRLLLAQGQASE